jgi:hypothetical protein
MAEVCWWKSEVAAQAVLEVSGKHSYSAQREVRGKRLMDACVVSI